MLILRNSKSGPGSLKTLSHLNYTPKSQMTSTCAGRRPYGLTLISAITLAYISSGSCGLLPARANSTKGDLKDSSKTADNVHPSGFVSPEIKGFHPIKKALQPVKDLEAVTIKLQEQIIELEGPIVTLQPSMLKLEKQLNSVTDGLDTTESQLTRMAVGVKGVRSDMNDLENEIRELDGPVAKLIKPIESVAKPMTAVNNKLTIILISVILSALAIAFGTPLVAVGLFMHRRKVFPKRT